MQRRIWSADAWFVLVLVSTYRIWHAIYQDIVHSHRMNLGICHTLARRAGALIFGSSFGRWVGLRYCYMMTTTFGNKKKSISFYLFIFTNSRAPSIGARRKATYGRSNAHHKKGGIISAALDS
ncbi:hypothetical protein J3E68DRAFT_109653 [Trichoderma sp. SZMC 28012]